MKKNKRSRLPAGIQELDDGRYHIRVAVSVNAGGGRKWRRKTMHPGATLAETFAAMEALKEGLREVEQEVEPDPATETLTVYAQRWSERKARRWRPQTARTTVRRLERHILPWWGDVRVCDVSRRQLMAWRDALQDKIGDGEGLSSQATVQGWWRVGLTLIRAALDEHELRDCTRGIDSPFGVATSRRESRTLSREDIEQLIAAMRELAEHWIVFAVAAYTGCRLGEALALRWCDVDMDLGLVYIRRSYAVNVSGTKFGLPKNGKPRAVGLVEPLRRLLEEHRASSPGLGEALIAQVGPAQPPDVSTLRRAVAAARAQCGVEQRVTFQVLRRSWITLAIAAGVDHEVLRESVGHAAVSMTRVYHAPRAETLRGAAETVWPAGVVLECGP